MALAVSGREVLVPSVEFTPRSMRLTVIILILSSAAVVLAQSGRVSPEASADQTAPAADTQPTVKELFDEVNGYIRAKGIEFDAKKIPFSEKLFDKTRLEQRQLAAKYAAMAGNRKDLAGDDYYYLGMLHWIAENLDGTLDSLTKFIASDGVAADRRQTARSIAIVVMAKQKKLDAAEAMLADYLRSEPTKLTERSRMEGELAKAYQSLQDFARMLPHAEECYKAAKAILKDASSRARGLDEILDAGMLVYEALRDSKDPKGAEAALDDIRITAAQCTVTQPLLLRRRSKDQAPHRNRPQRAGDGILFGIADQCGKRFQHYVTRV